MNLGGKKKNEGKTDGLLKTLSQRDLLIGMGEGDGVEKGSCYTSGGPIACSSYSNWTKRKEWKGYKNYVHAQD